MKLEQQVTNLELSKKLKELGVEQESLFYWMTGHNNPVEKPQFGFQEMLDKDLICSAFTVAELGEELKNWLLYNFYSMPNICDEGWEVDSRLVENLLADTEANARAKMLIYLKENKLWLKE